MNQLVVFLRLVAGSIIPVVLVISYLAIFICIILPFVLIVMLIYSIVCIKNFISSIFNKKNNTFDPQP